MIIVTGTKRSGTSMWMQILKASGAEVVGEEFSKNWKETIYEANPHGFYESPLRRGIFFATNPHPTTGAYIDPRQTHRHGVKVFIPGLCRTDLAYITRIVGTMRHWREYVASLTRLQTMEAEAMREKVGDDFEPPTYMDPVLEWWLENFALIRNSVIRSLPIHLMSYESVLRDPEEALRPVLEWLDVPDVEAGIAAVDVGARTQDRERLDGEHPHAAMFDELYELVHENRPLSEEFLKRLNATHLELVETIEEDVRRVLRARKARKQRAKKSLDVLHPDTMEALIHEREDQPSAQDT